MMMPMMGMGFLLLGGGGYMWYQQSQQQAIDDANAAKMKYGNVVISGLPSDTLHIVFNNRLVKNGDTVKDVPSGAQTVSVVYTGFQSITRPVVVPDSGKFLDLTLEMVPVDNTPTNAVAAAQNVANNAASSSQASARQQAAPTDSVEVRVIVTPAYADIYLDDKKQGTGKWFRPVPVGTHTIKMQATGCTPAIQTIVLAKGDQAKIVNQTLQGCSQ
jgi:hypothetical protein